MDFIEELFNITFGYFVNIEKRIHWMYLIASVVLAFYVFKVTGRKGSFFKYIFNKEVWLSRSATVDYCMFFFNGLVKIFLIFPYLYFGFELAFYVNNFLVERWGYMEYPWGTTTTVVVYTIVLMIVNDFFVYIVHFLMHKIPFLWEFHKIHHSATTMNPITQYRIHPIELIINNIQGFLVFGVVTGIFEYLSSNYVHPWVFLGANVLSFVFFMLGANLRHSHIRLGYFKWLEYLFVSPLQHQIHHSKAKKHWNKNMGSRLAIWDWLFGTLVISKDVEKLSFGLGAKQDKAYNSFTNNMINPFVNNYQRVKKYIQKPFKNKK